MERIGVLIMIENEITDDILNHQMISDEKLSEYAKRVEDVDVFFADELTQRKKQAILDYLTSLKAKEQ